MRSHLQTLPILSDWELDSLPDLLADEGALVLRKETHRLADFIAISEHGGQDFRCLEASGKAQNLIGSNLQRTPLAGYKSVFHNAGQGHSYGLPLHGELYFQGSAPPELLWFYCASASTSGDQTLICDGQALYQALPAAIQQLFQQEPLVYYRYQSQANWQRDYQCDRFETVRALLSEQQTEAYLEADGTLETRFTSSALRYYQNKWTFINNFLPFALRELQQPEATRARVRRRDGSAFETEMILTIAEIARNLSQALSWQESDILMIDNQRVLHGRDSIQDPKRHLYLRMSQKKKQQRREAAENE